MNHFKPLPLYERVKHYLHERIQSGEWPEGAKLPSEYELMDLLGASRMTIHRALREMQADGLIRRAQGVGTFVQTRPARSALLEITDIADDIAARGGRHAATLITQETIRADAALAEEFSLPRGAKLFHSLIVHAENGAPIQLEERFVTPLFAPLYGEQNFNHHTTAAYLAGIAPATQVEHVIQAVKPDQTTRRLLKIPAAEPCLRLNRRTWTAAGPATKSILTHPGSRYALGSLYDMPGTTPKKPA